MDDTKKIEMRPFDDGDWDWWSGCESTTPMISKEDVYVTLKDGRKAGAIFIIDGNSIEIDVLYDPDDSVDLDQWIYQAQMLTEDAAKFFVESLPLEGLTIKRLESLGFKVFG